MCIRDRKYILHLVPSGILWPDKLCVIGNGVVLDPIGLVEAINELRGQGVTITKDNLLISDRAHVVLPVSYTHLILRRGRPSFPIPCVNWRNASAAAPWC